MEGKINDSRSGVDVEREWPGEGECDKGVDEGRKKETKKGNTQGRMSMKKEN